jgi:hypothetical protein
MTPLRRMALILFALSILMLAAALYAARPVCICTLGQVDTFDPADCPIHADATFAEENEQ